MLEILNCSLMRFRCAPAAKRSEISALPGLRALLARVQTIFPSRDFPDHGKLLPFAVLLIVLEKIFRLDHRYVPVEG